MIGILSSLPTASP